MPYKEFDSVKEREWTEVRTMYILEYKQLHIVKEPFRENCTCQTYRWKQAAVCAEREPLEEILRAKPDKENWRVIGCSGGADNAAD